MPERRIKVLIVDDSAVVRKILTEGLAAFPEIEVVGTAIDPYVARDKILSLQPDVLTLDIEMPRMDGLSFLKLLMKHRPMPVIVISSLTSAGSSQALEALQSGAVEVVAKPDGSFSAQANCAELAAKIKIAFQARIPRGPSSISTPAPAPAPPAQPAPGTAAAAAAAAASGSAGTNAPGTRPVLGSSRLIQPAASHRGGGPAGSRQFHPRQIILMGASTGGTEALKKVLTDLNGPLPGICIVQHIPAHFSRAFAERLNGLCRFEVREARQGDRVRPGLALVAPGGYHMVLKWVGGAYAVDLSEGPMVHHQRPAVDVLFDSAVKAGAAPHALALLLTGMGADGAQGMLRLRQAGAQTVAQDEASCVVFGMPREAIRLGAAQKVLALDQMSGLIERHAAEVAQTGSPSGATAAP